MIKIHIKKDREKRGEVEGGRRKGWKALQREKSLLCYKESGLPTVDGQPQPNSIFYKHLLEQVGLFGSWNFDCLNYQSWNTLCSDPLKIFGQQIQIVPGRYFSSFCSFLSALSFFVHSIYQKRVEEKRRERIEKAKEKERKVYNWMWNENEILSLNFH